MTCSSAVRARGGWTSTSRGMQLGSGLVLPGGSWGGMGAGGVILHRFGMPTKTIAERQFNLSFLNTAIDGLALVRLGSCGLASGILSGEGNLLLTLLPAAVAGAGIIAALVVVPRLGGAAERTRDEHPKFAEVAVTLSAAVEDTRRLFHRGAWIPPSSAELFYLALEVTVLWLSFTAVHASPVPGFPIVVMAYIIGALGRLDPPAGVRRHGRWRGRDADRLRRGTRRRLRLVLLHQAIGLLVPVIGGAIAYTIIRRRLGPIHLHDANHGIAPPTGANES